MTPKTTTTTQKYFGFCPCRRKAATPTGSSSETPRIRSTQDLSRIRRNAIRSAACNVPTVMSASFVISTAIAYSVAYLAQKPSENSSFDISLQDVIFDVSPMIFVLASAACSMTSENIDAENCVQPVIRRGATEIDSIILSLIINLNETNNHAKSAALLGFAILTAGTLIATSCSASPERPRINQLDSMIENYPLALSVFQGARDAIAVLFTSHLSGDKPVVKAGWTITVFVRHLQMNSFDLSCKHLVKVGKQYYLETSTPSDPDDRSSDPEDPADDHLSASSSADPKDPGYTPGGAASSSDPKDPAGDHLGDPSSSHHLEPPTVYGNPLNDQVQSNGKPIFPDVSDVDLVLHFTQLDNMKQPAPRIDDTSIGCTCCSAESKNANENRIGSFKASTKDATSSPSSDRQTGVEELSQAVSQASSNSSSSSGPVLSI